MNKALPFFADFARVCSATLFLVASAAFVAIPLTLSGHPGDPVATTTRHFS